MSIDEKRALDHRAELKAQIELADRILWETRDTRFRYFKNYLWLENERARLACELTALDRAAKKS